MKSFGRHAFSLTEVIIAVGIFAIAIAAIIALLPGIARQGMENSDSLAAERLADPLALELRRLAATRGFATLAADFPILTPRAENGLEFFATRDASRLHSAGYPPSPGAISEGDRFFLIECWSFPEEPLRYTSGKQFVAIQVRVSWPYQIGSTVTLPSTRSQLLFTCSLTR